MPHRTTPEALIPDQAPITDETPQILEKVEAAGDAIRFYNNSVAQLDRAVFGEQHAKDVAIASLVSRKPLILSGIPGFGKSTLSEVMPWLIADMTDADIALISGQHDLTGNQLIGGEIGSTRRITDLATNETTEQYTGTQIKGIVGPTTKIVRLEEANGTNPYALRTLLPVLESRRIENAGGELEMPDLITVVATVNPTESSQSTFEISDAMASRFALGAVMGIIRGEAAYMAWDAGVRARIRTREQLFGPSARAKDMISPTVSMSGLRSLRAYTSTIAVSPSTDSKIGRIGFRLNQIFADHKIPQDGRIGQQLEGNSKTLAGLRNLSKGVEEDDLLDATRAVLLGRLGALIRTDHLDTEAMVMSATGL